MSKVAVIIPYFGKWPDWIDVYFNACMFNSIIDWYFVTDCIIPEKYAQNMNFISMSFSAYCELVSKKLGINFRPENPYKLCGLRPFYGFIHSDLISKYDFWGFGDVDVIWGDISSFYSNELLAKYDVFSTHADRVSGHLAIIRNKPQYTELCFKITNWQAKLQDEASIPLDEQDFSWLLYPASKYITKFYSKIIRKIFNWRNAWVIYYQIVPFVNVIFGTKSKRLYFKEQHTTPILGGDGRTFVHDSEDWLYKNGKVYNMKNMKEYIYLHFMIYKKNGFREDFFWKDDFYKIPIGYDVNNSIRISKNGIENSNNYSCSQ